MNRTVDGIVALVTLTCWLMSIYKLRDLIRDPRNLPLRALWIALVTITLSLSIQPWAPQIDRALGILDIGRITSNCLTLVSAGAAQAFLLYVTGTKAAVHRRVRRRLAAVAVCVTAIVTLFVLTPPRLQLDHPIVTSGDYYRGLPAPFNAPYTYLYLVYLGYAMSEAATLANRYARMATRPLLRLGLRLIAIGCAVGIFYVLLKLGTIITKLNPDRAPFVEPLIVVCFTVAILLILVGSTMPSWGPAIRLDRLSDHLASLSAYRRLGPLWQELQFVDPSAALLAEPHGLTGRWQVVRQARLRLVRRVVEIRDAYVSLRPYADPTIAELASRLADDAGLRAADRDAVIEAAVLAAAVHAQRSGHPPRIEVGLSPLASPTGDREADEQDPAHEVAWLSRIAHAYRRSPVVAATVAEASAARHKAAMRSDSAKVAEP